MLTAGKLRTGVLAIHGALALGLGLTFLYLRATMTNLLFEAVAVAIAILLSAAAFIVAAITDWFAAFSTGTKSVHRFTFYLLAGIALALAGVFLSSYPFVSMQWLVIFAAVHALAFGISAFVFALQTKHDLPERRAMYFFGAISVLFSGTMAGLVRDMDDLSATAVLGWYLCFIGAKILFFAWDCRRKTANGPWLGGGADNNVLPIRPIPTNTVKH